MNKLGNLLLIQSGGPTAVFNYTAYFLLKNAKKNSHVNKILYSKYGLNGLINNDLGDLNKLEKELPLYSGSLIGSARIKLDQDYDSERYQKILTNLEKNNIRYLLINGGNDTMDTANKLYLFLKAKNYKCNVVGIPKTIDNDLAHTDFSLGFPSAAKYLVTTIKELVYDFNSYNLKQINIIETMGRNAGWLTASAYLLNTPNKKLVDLIYLPEMEFSLEKFREDISELLKVKDSITVIVSEGIKSNGKLFIEENIANLKKDQFAHVQLGGAASILSNFCKEEFDVKSRGIELSLMQRAAHHLISKIDLMMTKKIAKYVIKEMINHTNFIPIIVRKKDLPFRYEMQKIDFKEVSNYERVIPKNWLIDNKIITNEFINYLKVLID